MKDATRQHAAPERPLISVIVPVYNVAPYVTRCLEDIRAQTYANLDIIVVDDGSTDGGPALCARQAGLDPRIRVVRQAHAGVAAARNRGLDAARGGYIGFVDPDDSILPSMFGDLLEALLRHRADMAQCGIWVGRRGADEPGGTASVRVRTGKWLLRRMIAGRAPATLWCNLYAARLWQGLRFSPGLCYEDEMLLPEVVLGSARVVLVPRRLYVYNRRGSGIVRSRKTMNHLRSKEAVLERMADFFRRAGISDELAAVYMCRLIPSRRLAIRAGEDIRKRDAREHNKRMHALFVRHWPRMKRSAFYAGQPLAKRLYWRLYRHAPRLVGLLAGAKRVREVFRRI